MRLIGNGEAADTRDQKVWRGGPCEFVGTDFWVRVEEWLGVGETDCVGLCFLGIFSVFLIGMPLSGPII